MAIKGLYASCSDCGFPISGRPGQAVSCPNCGISGTITGVTIPTPLFVGVLAFIAGVIISPYLKRQIRRVS